jgi:hypothetical protein
MASTDAVVSANSFIEALKRSKVTGEEFCISCLTFLGFPFSTTRESHIRCTGGARYVEGGGQLCQTCGKVPTPTSGYSEH